MDESPMTGHGAERSESVPATREAMRAAMPVTRHWAYLDHAAVAPLPAPTIAALHQWVDQAAVEAGTAWPRWRATTDELRRLSAELIGAHPDEIGFVPSTSAGINLVAEGLPWRDGDNVVVLANEFPSNQYPWLNQARRGVEVRRVAVEGGRVELNRIAEHIDSRTRVVAISWVGYASGYRIDVAEVADLVHRRGSLLMLDAIQALGVFPINVVRCGVDFLAADGHKWLMGPEGAGLFYCRRELLDFLIPVGVGWNSVKRAYDYQRIELDLRPSAARYEAGSPNMVGMCGFAASMDFMIKHGASSTHSPLADSVLEWVGEASERLRSLGATIISDWPPEHTSGILVFSVPGVDLSRARKDFEARGVVLSVRGGGLRVSPHAYNNSEDLDRLIDAVKDLAVPVAG